MGNQRSRGEGVFWAPLMQDANSLAFIDFRGKLFETDVREGNFAFGIRQMLPAEWGLGGWNFGLWAGYDIRRSLTANLHHQAAVGLELLSHNWDFRANGYIPFDDDVILSETSQGAVFSVEYDPGAGTISLVSQAAGRSVRKELAFWGVDGEVGYRIPLELLDKDLLDTQLRVYAGGFYFDHDDFKAIKGPRVRTELRFDNIIDDLPGSRLTLEAEWQWDDVRRDAYEVGGRLRIPLFAEERDKTIAARLSPQDKRMSEGLERDTDIVARELVVEESVASGGGSSGGGGGTATTEKVEDALTGVDFDNVVTVSGGGSISTTSTNAGANSLIILEGNVTGSQTLQGNQTLIGAGATIQVRGLTSGKIATFTVPGSRPNIDENSGAVLTIVGDNSHVSGVEITGNGGGSFAGSNRGLFVNFNYTNVAVSNTNITGVGRDGIYFGSNNTQIILRDVNITNANSEGIHILLNNQMTLTNINLNNTGTYGISTNNSNQMTLTNVTIDNNSDTGLTFTSSNQMTLNNVNISNTTVNGIGMNGGNQVTISNSNISNTGDGLNLSHTANTITLNNSVFSNNFTDDVIDTNAGATWAGSGNSFTGTVTDSFCETTGGQIGSVAFDSVATLGGGPGTCP